MYVCMIVCMYDRMLLILDVTKVGGLIGSEITLLMNTEWLSEISLWGDNHEVFSHICLYVNMFICKYVYMYVYILQLVLIFTKH